MVIPVPPGPRPNNRCPADIHFIPKDEHRKILDSMGSGGASAKIKALIEREGERQIPSEKRLIKARYILLRKEAMEQSIIVRAVRKKMIEIGITEEEIRAIEDDEDATN